MPGQKRGKTSVPGRPAPSACRRQQLQGGEWEPRTASRDEAAQRAVSACVALMRLIKFEFEDWRLLQHEELAASGLVVLFGANSSGKTSVQEAVEEVLTRKQRRRFDPATGKGDPPVSGYVWFELDRVHVAGHADVELHRALKTAQMTEAAWAILGAGVSRTLLQGATAQEAEDIVASQLAANGSSGTPGDRDQLARALVSNRRFLDLNRPSSSLLPTVVLIDPDLASLWGRVESRT